MARRTVVAGMIGAAAVQPAFAQSRAPRVQKEVLGFYYGWYANPAFSGGRWIHWPGPTGKEAPDEKVNTNTPLLGLYDSHNPAVVAQHARWAKQAGLTGVISGQWTRNSREDRSTALLIPAMHAQGMKVSVYIESQRGGYDGAVADLQQLSTTHARHPAWLKVGARPVVFLYVAALRALPASEWRRAAKQVAASGLPEPILVGDVDPRAAAYAEQAQWMEGTHTYVNDRDLANMTPAQVTAYADRTYPAWKQKAADKVHCATVSPGYNDTKGLPEAERVYPLPVVDRFGTEMLAAQWAAATKTDPDWVLITSFNAWNDGTEIEPSREWGDLHLEANRPFAQAFLRPAARRRR